MYIDHLLYAVQDIEVASERLAKNYGLASVEGGFHEEWGTGNRIVPLGSHHYIELFGVVDPLVAETNPIGQWLLNATHGGDRLTGLCIGAKDFDRTIERLGIQASNGQRVYQSGESVSWRQAGILESMLTGVPFFFEWNEVEGRLGLTEPKHQSEVHGISWVALGGDRETIRSWFGGGSIPGVHLVGGPIGIAAVGIQTALGEIVLSGGNL